MQAVETSDWSPVIEAQTRQTFQAADGGSAPAPSQEAAVVSPFSGEQQQDGSSQKQQGGGPSSPPPSGDDEFMELTPANVDKVGPAQALRLTGYHGHALKCWLADWLWCGVVWRDGGRCLTRCGPTSSRTEATSRSSASTARPGRWVGGVPMA